MSEPQIPVPVASPGEDPLLGSDSFIDAEKPEPGTESPEHKSNPDAGSGQGMAIAAEPISILRPGEDSVEAAPRSAARRRNAEEMSKRPSWLPEDWKIDLRVRSSGATAGLIDRYFIGPSGQRRFRSKNEVLHFLETGSNKKRKSTSDADAEPSESPVSSRKKSSKRAKKSKDVPKTPVSSAKKSKRKGKKSKDVPKKSEDVSKEPEDVPEEREDVLKESEDVPEEPEDVLKESEDVPEEREDVPNGVDVETDG